MFALALSKKLERRGVSVWLGPHVSLKDIDYLRKLEVKTRRTVDTSLRRRVERSWRVKTDLAI